MIEKPLNSPANQGEVASSDQTDPQSLEVKDTPHRETSINLFWLGVVLTLVVLVATGLFALVNWSAFAQMKPNEWGDFLAGIGSTLAFLWLILGFLQQRQELQNSVDALVLQSQELRHSVQEQRRMADLQSARLTAEMEERTANAEAEVRAAQPVFKLSARGAPIIQDGRYQQDWKIRNISHGVNNLVVEIDGYESQELGRLFGDVTALFRVRWRIPELPRDSVYADFELPIDLTYTDRRQHKMVQTIFITVHVTQDLDTGELEYEGQELAFHDRTDLGFDDGLS